MKSRTSLLRKIKKQTKMPDADDQEKDKKDKKKKKKGFATFGKSKPKKPQEPEEPAPREVSSPGKLNILKLPQPAMVVPKDTSGQPQLDVSNESGEVFVDASDQPQVPTQEFGQTETDPKQGPIEGGQELSIQLKPGMDLGELDKDWSIQSRVVKTVVVKKVLRADGTEVEPEEISSVTRTEVTKQEGEDAPEKEITLIKKELIDGEEKITEEHSHGDRPLAITTAMPIMASVPSDFELVERKVVKKSKLTRTIIHPDGHEEVVVEEKEEVVGDDDRDRVMKEFEPDTKPQIEDIQVEPAAEPVSLSITEEGDSDFRLPGGQVEVVGGEVVRTTMTTTTMQVEHGDSARIDAFDDDTATEEQAARAEKEDSPVDLDTSQDNTDSTDFSTSDSGSKPVEPLGASAVQSDYSAAPSRGERGGGRGRKKRNRRR